jgi:hypothetical protein
MLPDDRRRWVRRRGAQPGGRRSPPECILSFLRTRYRGGGKVENLFLVFNFSRAFVAVAVGMWESRQPSAGFPRGSWKEREGCLWLSRFPQPRHFHGSSLTSVTGRATRQDCKICRRRCRLRSRLPGPLRAIAAVLPIQDSRGHKSSLLSRISSLNCHPSKVINMRPNSCHVISRPSTLRSGTEPLWESSHSILPRTTR